MIGWIIGILVVIIVLGIILKKINRKSSYYKPKSKLRKFLDACCSHRQ